MGKEKIVQELEEIGLKAKGNILRNMSVEELIDKAVKRKEGVLSKTGALTVTTGKYTGRSPNDRFIVDLPSVHNEVNWNNTNKAVSEKMFDELYKKVCDYLSEKKELFVFDGRVGADKENAIHTRVINENAYHNLAIRNLLIRISKEELKKFKAEAFVIHAPGFKAVPKEDETNSEAFIILNLEKKIILIGGTSYAGEMKKSLFSLMNYTLPFKKILPMHCSCNVGKDGRTALFFGLSGTGKTSLSADPNRRLVGDDEHGWSEKGVFNFEGGIYAKCINLRQAKEPQIWNSIKKGAVVENVVMNSKTLEYDFDDDSLTENSRTAFPINFIPDFVESGMANHPKAIIFLTADAFGVMPPISRLTKEQAIYHFLSGYTSKLAGTERGIIEPKATFSAFFGEPFMPSKSETYANLLKHFIDKTDAKIFLINTGWIGGEYGTGKRIDIDYSRKMVTAALEGQLDATKCVNHEIFNLMIPKEVSGIPSGILNPKDSWKDNKDYDEKARALAKMFEENIKKFKNISDAVRNAGPKA